MSLILSFTSWACYNGKDGVSARAKAALDTPTRVQLCTELRPVSERHAHHTGYGSAVDFGLRLERDQHGRTP
jgi:hypothetical protein